MKVAISLPDEIYREADSVAKSLGVSRSELYARAVADFLDLRRPARIIAQLNEVYRTRRASVDPALARMQKRTVQKEKW
jgi:metal-responsive CopG/Arc/MetJ family transcriptional regulator